MPILSHNARKTPKCNKGTSVPEVTSVAVYNNLDAHIYMHLVQTNVKSQSYTTVFKSLVRVLVQKTSPDALSVPS